jgi:hypothetical protein
VVGKELHIENFGPRIMLTHASKESFVKRQLCDATNKVARMDSGKQLTLARPSTCLRCHVCSIRMVRSVRVKCQKCEVGLRVDQSSSGDYHMMAQLYNRNIQILHYCKINIIYCFYLPI